MGRDVNDRSAVAEPFRWVSPQEIIGDDGPELDGDRAPRQPLPSAPVIGAKATANDE